MTPRRPRKISTIIIVALFAIIAIALCVRMYCHYPAGDELRYFYTFQDPHGKDYFAISSLTKVYDFSDVIRSMGDHYTGVNGRVLVHTFEMTFSSILGPVCFYPLNLIVLVLAIVACVRIYGKKLHRNIVWWSIVVILWLHAFPEPSRLWLSSNLAPNYLWPSLGVIALLWSIKEYKPLWLQCTLAFMLGASNEGFAFPLCGALWCISLWGDEMRRPRLMTMIMLSLGCLVLVCAPGNWNRLGANDSSANGILVGLELIAQQPAVWILVATAAFVAIRKGLRHLWDEIKNMPAISIAFVLSLLMSLVLHTGLRSLTPLSLFAVLCTLSLLAPMIPERAAKHARVAAISLMTLVTAHQIWATVEHIDRYRQIGDVIERARVLRQGKFSAPAETIYIPYDWKPAPPLLRRYVYDQPPTRFGTAYQWRLQGCYYAGIQINTYLPGDSISHTPRAAKPAVPAR